MQLYWREQFREEQLSVVFNDMTAHMINSKSINSIITEILIRGRKINEIVTKPCFQLWKNVRLNSAHYFILKIISKR